MKKLALALVASSFVAGAASADISTGFYLGAGIGANSNQVNGGTSLPGGAVSFNGSFGRHNVEGSVYAGYGFVTGCTYLGGELGYTFTGNKIRATLSFPVVGTASLEAERRNVINAALLAGWKLTPSTLVYGRLGLNNAQYKLNNNSKRRFSFAPGAGVEVAAHKNVRLRLQYVYDFGGKLEGTDSRLKSQAVTLGVAYKF